VTVLHWVDESEDGGIHNVYAYLPGDKQQIAWITWVGGFVERPDEGWVARVAVNGRTKIEKLSGFAHLAEAKQAVADLLAREERLVVGEKDENPSF
jgi:hypothetical protein